ncbi:hypothetical protein [Streptomyces sp. NRRL B-24484]|uniref:hypothetical protein n=1 Tax=Streptomyces sp. NRRL B-24484 TaxID=1463833 RepID=UPI0004C081A2|nr:hypothetical protein [Streptomyces sp. NRRL B-24484]
MGTADRPERPAPAADRPRHGCAQWLPAEGRYCGRSAREYRTGLCCPDHTPARQAGRDEPESGPGYTPQRLATPASASAVIDAQAIASGKRRSSPREYRLAQAATGRAPHPSTRSTG